MNESVQLEQKYDIALQEKKEVEGQVGQEIS